jgi:hypothetical protein
MKNTQELIERWPYFDEETKIMLLSAISTRGRYKGFLLSNPPSEKETPMRYMAWQALISNLAPSRVSVMGLMLSEHNYWFNIFDNQFDTSFIACINAVEPDFRWNINALNQHPKEERLAAVEKLLQMIKRETLN